MNKELAEQLSKKLKISTPQIVREEYELIVLKEIYTSDLADKIVFKGGTALRLAYDSPRFSDDLDFSQLKNIKLKDFIDVCENIATNNPNIELVEALNKFNTLFALFKVSDSSISQNLSIKIEISTRKEDLKRDKDYSLILLKSSISPINLIANTFSLEKILTDKLDIETKRIRDVFDIWFIKQNLGDKDIKMDFSGFNKNEVKRELNKLLPVSYRGLVDDVIKSI
ncbi:nucleotidyl transferase AbiEii/AbiGii toxin family protein [Patescibacteria group bacterium]|nr:nucleotidyl transferase AbiEii/AbiGii toxin family protein [Patescibacteria group bacterium]